MSTSVTLNGSTYSIPAAGESTWGTNVSNYLIAIATSTFQKSGGTFTLTTEANFGATYGIKLSYIKSQAMNPSSTGIIRLGNTESIKWRNAANNSDLDLTVNSLDVLQYNSINIPTVSSTDTFTNKTLTSPVINNPTGIVKGDVGLGNVDNTSDATKDAATAILTNKTITTPIISTPQISSGTASTVPYLDVSKNLVSSAITPIELGYLSGTTGTTGANKLVRDTSPTLVTPVLGAATATSINSTTIPTSKTLVVTTDKLSALSATTSAELAGVISDETGSGALVFGTSPTIGSANLTTPSTDVITLDGQASTPTNPSSGFYKAYVKDTTQKLTILDSSGVETTVGTGSSSINYITANDGAVQGSWTTYADAAGTSPVDGTGGSPTVTYATSTSSALRGTTNFLFTHAASNQQGQGFSYDLTIDPSDKGKVLQISTEYLIASGTYADDDLQFWIYDVTNAVLIQPTPFKLKNSGIIEKFGMEFQTSSNSTSYRLIGHVATSTATAYTIRFDNWNLGPQAKLYGSPVTDPVSVTYTLTNAGNATATNGTISKDGAYAIGRVLITIGSSLPTGAITLNLPNGYVSSMTGSLDSSIVTQTATQYTGVAYQLTSTTIIFQGGTGNWDATHPLTWVNGNSFWVTFRTQIVGWSSSVIVSSDAATNIVAARATRVTTQTAIATSTPTKVGFNSASFDKNGAFDTTNNRYIVSTPGVYEAFTKIYWDLTMVSASDCLIMLYKNGLIYSTLSRNIGTANMTQSGSDTLDLVAGDYLEIFVQHTNGSNRDLATGNYFTVKKLSGPAQIAASESVNGRWTAGNSQVIASAADNVIATLTKEYDSHNSMNVSTGVYTVPMSGKYRISAHITSTSISRTTGTNKYAVLKLEGTKTSDLNIYVLQANVTCYVGLSGSTTNTFNAGDTISVGIQNLLSESFTILVTTADNWISIERVGN